MSKMDFVLDLAKLIIAAAWADGKLTNDEINALKDLLFRFDDITGEDWKTLQMYMDSPVTEIEQKELLDRILTEIKTSDDKQLAVNMLENVFTCDGNVTTEEKDLMSKFSWSIERVDTNIITRLSKTLKSRLNKRMDTVNSSHLREKYFQDYIQNTIFFDIMQKKNESGIVFDKDELELRKICLSAGLLTEIANIDCEISEDEKNAICEVISHDWKLSKKQAFMLVNAAINRTAKGLDYYRLSHNYFESTDYDERRQFLHTLFRVAKASNGTSY